MLQLVLDFSGLTPHICFALDISFWANRANALTTTGTIFVALLVSVCISRHQEPQKAGECPPQSSGAVFALTAC